MRQTLIIDKYNASLEYDNGCLVLRTPDEPVRRIPLRYLERVVCTHHADVHTGALARWPTCRQQALILCTSTHAAATSALHSMPATRRNANAGATNTN